MVQDKDGNEESDPWWTFRIGKNYRRYYPWVGLYGQNTYAVLCPMQATLEPTSAPTTPLPTKAPTNPTMSQNPTDQCEDGNLAWIDEPLGSYVSLDDDKIVATKNNHEGADRSYVYGNEEYTTGV